MGIFSREKKTENSALDSKQMLLAAISLETIQEIKSKIGKIESKLVELEKRVEEKTILEPKQDAKQETVPQQIGTRIEVKPTKTESKKVEKIRSLLLRYGKLSSFQLAQILNLSRTRSNEYFKLMEQLGLVEGIMVGKEKYYQLVNVLG